MAEEPAYRQSCDRCHGQKLRCVRDSLDTSDACHRCRRLGTNCKYGFMLRKGRPPCESRSNSTSSVTPMSPLETAASIGNYHVVTMGNFTPETGPAYTFPDGDLGFPMDSGLAQPPVTNAIPALTHSSGQTQHIHAQDTFVYHGEHNFLSDHDGGLPPLQPHTNAISLDPSPTPSGPPSQDCVRELLDLNMELNQLYHSSRQLILEAQMTPIGSHTMALLGSAAPDSFVEWLSPSTAGSSPSPSSSSSSSTSSSIYSASPMMNVLQHSLSSSRQFLGIVERVNRNHASDISRPGTAVPFDQASLHLGSVRETRANSLQDLRSHHSLQHSMDWKHNNMGLAGMIHFEDPTQGEPSPLDSVLQHYVNATYGMLLNINRNLLLVLQQSMDGPHDFSGQNSPGEGGDKRLISFVILASYFFRRLQQAIPAASDSVNSMNPRTGQPHDNGMFRRDKDGACTATQELEMDIQQRLDRLQLSLQI